MTEDSPIYSTETLVITTNDGALLSAAPYTFRADGRSKNCWRLVDTLGGLHKTQDTTAPNRRPMFSD